MEKLKLGKVLGKTPRDHRQLVDKAINQALDNLTRNRAHFVHEDLFREALYVAPEFGLGPYEVLEATLKRVSTDDQIVRLDTLVGERYTTTENLDAELVLYRLATEAQRPRRCPGQAKATGEGPAEAHDARC